MTYGSIIWGQTANISIKRIQIIQNKAIRIINFSPYNSSTANLYRKSNILKFSDYVKLQNFLLVHDNLNNKNPLALQNSFKLAKDVQRYPTRGAENLKVLIPKIRKVTYGKFSINFRAASVWNDYVTKFPNEALYHRSKQYCKRFITKHIIESYIP